jgi:hypothetical protein
MLKHVGEIVLVRVSFAPAEAVELGIGARGGVHICMSSSIRPYTSPYHIIILYIRRALWPKLSSVRTAARGAGRPFRPRTDGRHCTVALVRDTRG